MKREVRFVGGENAGQTMQWDLNKGDVIKVPLYPDFPMGALPGDETTTTEFRVEVYRVHMMHYGTGHSYVFAAPDKWPTVGMMNELWHGYQKGRNNG